MFLSLPVFKTLAARATHESKKASNLHSVKVVGLGGESFPARNIVLGIDNLTHANRTF